MPDNKSTISRRYAGLQPAKPGEVRNPTGANGATKRRAQLQQICQRVLGKPIDITQGGKALKASGIEAICIAMRNEAIKGDVGAATWCRDTAYGKPTQMLGNDPENPFGEQSLSEFAAKMNGRPITDARGPVDGVGKIS